MRRLRQTGIKFDKNNPFTYCDTNKLITTEKEHQLLGIHRRNNRNSNYLPPPTKNNYTKKLNKIGKKNQSRYRSLKDLNEEEKARKTRSAIGYRRKKRKIPVYEKLNNQAKGRTREGYFRKLKGVINQNQLEIGQRRDVTLSKNLMEYESNKVMKKQLLLEKDKKNRLANINFEEIIAKPKKMSMKNYLNYKRQIFLSIMRQKDIRDNINDMNNLIKEAKDELDNNLKRKKKLQVEINNNIKDSKNKLLKVKQDVAEKEKELKELATALTQIKSEKNQTSNEVKDLEQEIKVLEKYEYFIMNIKNLDGDEIEDLEYLKQIEEDEIEEKDLENEDDLFLTKQKGVIRKIDFHTMSQREKKNFLLSDFEAPVDFVDLLRNIESENLYVIQLSQTTKEDKNILDIQLENLRVEYRKKLKEISDNIKRLKQKNDQIEKNIYEKKIFLNSTVKKEISEKLLDKDDPEYEKSRKELLNVEEIRERISKLFLKFAIGSDLDMKDSQTLTKLLIIEKNFNKLKKFNEEKEEEFKEVVRKKLVKKSKFRRSYLPKKTIEKRYHEIKSSAEEKKKDEEEKNKNADLKKRILKRGAKPRTFIEAKKVKKKEDSKDKEKVEYLRYFG